MNKKIIFLGSIMLICVLTQLSLLSGYDWFQYSRADINAGQWWRYISANLVHLSWKHLAMNLFGLGLIYTLFPNALSWSGWLVVFILSCLSVTFGIWLFNPDVAWYVGLSGVLHGILIVVLFLDYVNNKHWLNILLILALLAKLVWEALMGPMPGSEATAGGPVFVQAHFYGIMGGVVMLVCLYLIKTRR